MICERSSTEGAGPFFDIDASEGMGMGCWGQFYGIWMQQEWGRAGNRRAARCFGGLAPPFGGCQADVRLWPRVNLCVFGGSFRSMWMCIHGE